MEAVELGMIGEDEDQLEAGMSSDGPVAAQEEGEEGDWMDLQRIIKTNISTHGGWCNNLCIGQQGAVAHQLAHDDKSVLWRGRCSRS